MMTKPKNDDQKYVRLVNKIDFGLLYQRLRYPGRTHFVDTIKQINLQFDLEEVTKAYKDCESYI
jgi:hypothetical protein